jgi:hypothetical protein
MPGTHKITLSIPLSLWDRLQPFRNNINISGVLTNALDKEVSRQERAMKDLDDMSQEDLLEFTKSLLVGRGRSK